MKTLRLVLLCTAGMVSLAAGLSGAEPFDFSKLRTPVKEPAVPVFRSTLIGTCTTSCGDGNFMYWACYQPIQNCCTVSRKIGCLSGSVQSVDCEDVGGTTFVSC